MSTSPKQRSNFTDLLNKDNHRYSYDVIYANQYQKLKNVKKGDDIFITLHNRDTDTDEIIEFVVSCNQYFPLTEECHVYGLVVTTDQTIVQIELFVHEDVDYNFINAYLRPPIFKCPG